MSGSKKNPQRMLQRVSSVGNIYNKNHVIKEDTLTKDNAVYEIILEKSYKSAFRAQNICFLSRNIHI